MTIAEIAAEIEKDIQTFSRSLDVEAAEEFETFWTDLQKTTEGPKISFMRTMFLSVYLGAYRSGAQNALMKLLEVMHGATGK